MKQVLIDIIGHYHTDSTAEGIAQIDWAWIMGAIFLLAFIICLLKLLGGLLCAK